MSRARHRLLLAAASGAWIVATACARDAAAPTAVEPGAPSDTTLMVPSIVQAFSVRTYDGSGQAVHPDFVTPVNPWSHRPRYLALTPYPNGDTKFENPVLYSGADGMNWTVAKGTPNPLVYPKNGYLSDPDVVYANARNALFLYYRQASDSDYIHLIRSQNGRDWEPPIRIIAGPSFGVLSPSVVRRAKDDWLMWTVRADGGCRGPGAAVELRRSNDGIAWSPPEPVQMDLRGYSPWHIDVQWIPSLQEYWALVPVKTFGTCATRQLYLAVSKDAVNWTSAPQPAARAGEIAEFRDVVYRSTFAYDKSTDAVTIWLSGARMVGDWFVWSTAAVRRARAELFSPARRSAIQIPSERRREVDELFQPPE